jgi:predicted TIM-barrel fold metal-dependent hydrolase
MNRRQFINDCAWGLAATSAAASVVPRRAIVIDAHAHFGYLGMGREASFEEALEAADEAGIDKLCVSSLEAIAIDMEAGNKALYQLMKRYPDRVIGFAALPSSRFGEKGLDEIQRAIEVYGMKGVGELVTYTYNPLDTPDWILVLEKAASLRVPVLAHATPAACVEAARRVPEATVLMAHLGTGLGLTVDEWIQGIELAKTARNVYVETCTSITSYGQIEMAVKELGAERVVFGTDLPLLDPSVQKAKITGSDLSKGEKEMIFGRNMARILGISEFSERS